VARWLLLASATVVVVLACSDDVAAPPRPQLEVTDGDAQRAIVGSALPTDIMVQLLDARERPLSGVAVTWQGAPELADVITPQSPVTDNAGRARAHWQLDGTPGAHTLTVTTANGATAHATAWAYVRPFANVHAMPVMTYDGSGQAVHPDFVLLPPAWAGDPFRLVATPYPEGNATLENPSLFTGSDGSDWTVPQRVSNPLVRPDAGYLSDPDILYDPDAGELRIYYREVTTKNEIWLIRSTNGTSWSVPVPIVQAPNHEIVSPTVVRRSANDWLMWSVNSGPIGCGAQRTTVELRRSTDGISWTNPETATLSDPDGFPWHIDVEWIASLGQYWAVYPVKVAGGCTTDRLRFATSTDGLHWQSYPSPVLTKGVSEQLNDVIYRSSLAYDDVTGEVTLWYSGARLDHSVYTWHLAWERMPRTDLFARVNQAPTTMLRTQPAQTNVPQLTNETAP